MKRKSPNKGVVTQAGKDEPSGQKEVALLDLTSCEEDTSGLREGLNIYLTKQDEEHHCQLEAGVIDLTECDNFPNETRKDNNNLTGGNTEPPCSWEEETKPKSAPTESVSTDQDNAQLLDRRPRPLAKTKKRPAPLTIYQCFVTAAQISPFSPLSPYRHMFTS
jgi:hypothetical protein